MDDKEPLPRRGEHEVYHRHDEDDSPTLKCQRASRSIPGRRLRIFFNFFSVPPKAANRRALSRAMSASRPSFTSEVFSCIPESRAAFLKSRSSMFSVVRIWLNMHHSCIRRQARKSAEVAYLSNGL